MISYGLQSGGFELFGNIVNNMYEVQLYCINGQTIVIKDVVQLYTQQITRHQFTLLVHFLGKCTHFMPHCGDIYEWRDQIGSFSTDRSRKGRETVFEGEKERKGEARRW